MAIDQGFYNSLIPLKTSGEKTPLYIIHGLGLNVFSFKILAECLDKTQPVYALQAKGLDGASLPSDDLKIVAKEYVDEMLMQNPCGPYALAGYSSGGIIAYEMRKQLEALGKPVIVLTLLDADTDIAETKVRAASPVDRKIKRKFSAMMWTLTHPSIMLKYHYERLHRKYFLVKYAETKSYYQLLDQIAGQHMHGFAEYELTKSSRPLYLFRAEKRSYYITDRKYLGWNKYTDDLKISTIPGDHNSMLKRPAVELLAGMLQKTLNERQEEFQQTSVLNNL
jgi:thioesterase domain-containing protein